MTTRELLQFHWADYLVFAISLCVSIGIGVYHIFFGTKNNTSSDQLVGGRNLKIIPVAMSCIMGSLAAPFFIGIPVELYSYGAMYSTIFVAFILAAPVLIYGYIPTLHRLQLISSYEYLEMRFGKLVRTFSSTIYVIMMVFYMGVVIYTPAQAFTQVIGISVDVIIVIICVICTFYTAMGGVRAVVWADVFQTTVIFVGLLTLLIKGCIDSGGPTNVYNIASEGGRLDFTEISPDPTVRHTWWTQSIGGLVFGLSMSVGNQAVVQRALSISSLKDTQISMLLYAVGTLIILLLISGIGFVLFAYYHDCDPITSEAVTAGDQLIPLFMMDVLGSIHGIPGLFTAGIFSATLSSMAAGVNALAAVLFMDIVQPLYKYKTQQSLNDRAGSIITRSIAISMGFVTMGVAYLAPHMGPTLLQIVLSLFGMVGGPLLGVFTMAIFIPCTNQWGALVGLLCSLVMTFWISIGAIVHPTPPVLLSLRTDGCVVDNSTISTTLVYSVWGGIKDSVSSFDVNDLYKVSYMWYGPIAIIVACLVGLLVSILTGGCRQKVDHSLVFNYQGCCCLNISRKCCCLIEYDNDEKTLECNNNIDTQIDTFKEKDSKLSNVGIQSHFAPDDGHNNISYVPDYEEVDIYDVSVKL